MRRVPGRVQHLPRFSVTPLIWLRFLAFPMILFGGLAAAGAFLAALVIALTYPNLPSLEVLTDYQPKIPMRVYTAEGAQIGEFGEERRSLVSIKAVPEQLKHAILAAEDERFYQHAGIDYLGAEPSSAVDGGPYRARVHRVNSTAPKQERWTKITLADGVEISVRDGSGWDPDFVAERLRDALSKRR